MPKIYMKAAPMTGTGQRGQTVFSFVTSTEDMAVHNSQAEPPCIGVVYKQVSDAKANP